MYNKVSKHLFLTIEHVEKSTDMTHNSSFALTTKEQTTEFNCITNNLKVYNEMLNTTKKDQYLNLNSFNHSNTNESINHILLENKTDYLNNILKDEFN